MQEHRFDSKGIEDVNLTLVHDAEKYTDKMFSLDLTDGNGNELCVLLDGIQVGDIIADAKGAGLPVGWESPDGMPRIQNPDGSCPVGWKEEAGPKPEN